MGLFCVAWVAHESVLPEALGRSSVAKLQGHLRAIDKVALVECQHRRIQPLEIVELPQRSATFLPRQKATRHQCGPQRHDHFLPRTLTCRRPAASPTAGFRDTIARAI